MTAAVSTGLREVAAVFGAARLPAEDELVQSALVADVGDQGRQPTALAVELVYEGYLAHYRHSRVLPADVPEETRLLAGDYLYAHGLRIVAGAGDVEAVDLLAGLMASCSFARVEEQPPAVDDGLWELTVLAVASAPRSVARRVAARTFERLWQAVERSEPARLADVVGEGRRAVRHAAGLPARGSRRWTVVTEGDDTREVS